MIKLKLQDMTVGNLSLARDERMNGHIVGTFLTC
jgi:hypothetical protein